MVWKNAGGTKSGSAVLNMVLYCVLKVRVLWFGLRCLGGIFESDSFGE